jgi:hypothetical protein
MNENAHPGVDLPNHPLTGPTERRAHLTRESALRGFAPLNEMLFLSTSSNLALGPFPRAKFLLSASVISVTSRVSPRRGMI